MKLSQMIKKADILLLIVLVLSGLASTLLVKGGGIGENVVVTVDGKPYGTYPLSVDRIVDVDTEFGHNQITIKSGTVCISESDCAGHDCENFGTIAQARQSIMCLPHRLIVTITGESDIDVVVY